MEAKIDKIVETVTAIQIIMAKQEINLANNTDSLKDHMLRTAIAEKRITKLENFSFWIKGGAAILVAMATLLGFLIHSGILHKLL